MLHTYPLYRQGIEEAHIVEFTALETGKVIEVNKDNYDLGYESHSWMPHTDSGVWYTVNDPRIDIPAKTLWSKSCK